MRYFKRADNKPSSMFSQEQPPSGISAAIRRWSLCVGTVCTLQLMAVAAPVLASDYSLIPWLAVSEEYTDNVYETHHNKKSDYITRVQPGVAMKYTAPLWDWDLSYSLDYLHYAKRNRNDDLNHNISGNGLVRIVDEVLFLEVSDVYKKVSLDVTRDISNESLYVNQSDQNVATVSPYLVLHPTSRLTLKTGYRYINTWYEKTQAISKQDHIGFISGEYEITPKFFLTADYIFTREIPENASNFYRHEAYLGPRYEYAEKSFIYAKGGFIDTDYDNGTHSFNPAWKAGLIHTFDSVIVDVSTGRDYTEDPLGVSTLSTYYKVILTKNLQRGTVSLHGSYTEFSDTTLDRITDKRYSGGFNSEYELIRDLRGTLGLTYENYEDMRLNGTTDKYYVGCGLLYDFGNGLTVGLSYKYIDYSSKEIELDNKQVNRVILEVKKVF